MLSKGVVSAFSLLNFLSPVPVLAADLQANMTDKISALAELRPLLSSGAAIITKDNCQFANLTSRWREFLAPDISVVVEATTEKDIQQIVRIADKFNIPFVARSGGHGATESLADAQSAIQVDFRKLNQVKLSKDGKSATIGGGATGKHVIDELAAVGKRAVTGICECVGLSAVIMGGGHGWYQGQLGLAADQVISARLVLPNGDLITVSDKSHPDLFWAIRGAGHNFGLVTEWEYRVYDTKENQWSYEVFIYSQDKLEALYELANSMLKDQPAEATHWGYIVKVAEIDPDHPILWFAIVYDGPTETAREYAKPLHDLGPLMVQAGEGDLHDLATVTFQDKDGAGCAYGLTSLRYPIGLKSYNVAAVRKVYDHIDETFRNVPEIAGSFFLLEGYSTQAVKAVDAASTAFPHRDDEILVTSYVQYKPNATIDPIAEEFGKTLRGFLLEGSDDPEHLRAYVNYANGDEPLEAVYGWEDWRLQKLKALKRQFDPKNAMKYYVPFV
ncbi:putative 6-hydroxy-d-nicotine oxidase [Rosellinia necatrix]|uniref:Putative 6-hydroxy-d-nicotine oxidase n=1 Tax=Rosellinia necatrix TaxID=77044 RepID=A0A1S7UKX7_ROSNE|nr:putative 6-hydroxy-d-nicotine oxidase [Rosellinia necatrix]